MSEPLPRSEALMEVLPFYVDDGAIMLAVLGELTLQVGWHAAVHPNEVACGLSEEFGLPPIVAHSTSWRYEPGKLLVTYAVVAQRPDDLAPMLRARPIGRTELARGTATRAPAVLSVAPVAEHALRHLAWLSHDDEHIRASLPDAFAAALAAYPPEPFRSFESGW